MDRIDQYELILDSGFAFFPFAQIAGQVCGYGNAHCHVFDNMFNGGGYSDLMAAREKLDSGEIKHL